MTQTAQPIIGLGSALSIGTQGGTPTFTAIGKAKKITPPQPKWGTEDTTTLDAGPAATRTFMKTLLDPGEISVEGLYESADAGQTALQAAFLAVSNSTNGAAYPFKLALSVDLAGGQTTTGDTFTFSALVTDFAIVDVEVDKPFTFKATLKITGAVNGVLGS